MNALTEWMKAQPKPCALTQWAQAQERPCQLTLAAQEIRRQMRRIEGEGK